MALHSFTQECFGDLANDAPKGAEVPNEFRFVLFGVAGCGKSSFMNTAYRVCRGKELSPLFETPFEAHARRKTATHNWSVAENVTLSGRSMLPWNHASKYRLFGVDGM